MVTLAARVGAWFLQARAGYLVCALSTMVLMGGIDHLLDYRVLSRMGNPFLQVFLPPVLVGLAGACASCVLLYALRSLRRNVEAEHERAAYLNHIIRNSLEVIALVQHLQSSEEHRALVTESVDRIDRTLKEMFPVQRRSSQSNISFK